MWYSWLSLLKIGWDLLQKPTLCGMFEHIKRRFISVCLLVKICWFVLQLLYSSVQVIKKWNNGAEDKPKSWNHRTERYLKSPLNWQAKRCGECSSIKFGNFGLAIWDLKPAECLQRYTSNNFGESFKILMTYNQTGL